MAIAFKPTCGLNSFTLQYVNSQCQHDSLLKLAAKLHLFTETSKFPSDYFEFSLTKFQYRKSRMKCNSMLRFSFATAVTVTVVAK